MDTVLIEQLPRVRAGLLYLQPTTEKPRSLEYEPPPGAARTTAVYREHTVEIRDMRPVSSTVSLEREGFELLTAPTSIRNFDSEDAIRTQYYPEMVSLLKEVT